MPPELVVPIIVGAVAMISWLLGWMARGDR